MGWIDLAQDKERWWTLVNALPQNAGNFLTDFQTLCCQWL